MASKKIMVRNDGYGMEEVLSLAEEMAAKYMLNEKKAMHLRLLSEEMMAMLRSVVGNVVAEYWIEETDDIISLLEIHLSADTRMYKQHMRELISVSSSGENYANKGILGKIRMLFTAAFTPENAYVDEIASQMYGVSQMDVNGAMIGNASMYWSLNQYRNGVKEDLANTAQPAGAKEAWDELEKSVIANLADEVKVGIRGKHVDLIVFLSC